jgi:PAS domain S-box-containing protein
MITQVDRDLNLAIVTDDRELAENLTELIRDFADHLKITHFHFESSLIDSIDECCPDIIISDKREDKTSCGTLPGRVHELRPEARIICILNEDPDLTGGMIESGIYDILTPSSISRIRIILKRLLEDIEEYSKLKQLEKEQDFNNIIVESARSMLSIINRNYIYEKVNTKFCDAQNLTVDSIIGKSLSEVWGVTTFENNIKKNVDLCFSGSTVRYEAKFDTPFFGSRYYEVIFRPVTRGTGKITHLLAETFDITELKQSQQVVNEMEEEFKKLETNLPIGFVRCETDGTIIHTNNAFLRIIECDDEKLVSGLNIRDFYTERGLFDIHVQELKNETSRTFGRVPLYTLNNSEIACRISGFVVTDDDGESSYIDFAFEDSSRELMLENRLLQAHKLETIGSLAGGLAHDFNNILTTINGYSEMLLDESRENSAIAEKIRKILAAVTKAQSLTNQILTFSRQVEQQRIAINVYDVLRETIGFVESGKKSNIGIKDRIADIGAMVYADPTQLFRVFLNLMTNGIQAIGDKEGILSISLTKVDGSSIQHQLSKDIVAEEYAEIIFEDTGTGMDQSVMHRIFEPYFTTKDIGEGTGLGLSVVHGIIAEIEGEILVTSKKNKGTVFTVYLPVYKDYTSDFGDNTGSRTLLLLRGNKFESSILSLALEKSGYNLISASDKGGLLRIFAENVHIPDMIIYMDDSEEITIELIDSLYREKKIQIPLLIITENNRYLSAEKLLISGLIRQVLTKPVSLKEIQNAIQMFLN